ncbi:MAG: prolyl oligopeptidase family serine peptidase [Deltaproteobacteria bacterium]|nr:prolyl oligopeptidase family serine peptidase [Deltaproteobacteria bacterium]
MCIGLAIAACGAEEAPVPPLARGAAPASPAPAVPIDPVVDTRHGLLVVDPYRWLERDAPATRAVFAAQDAHARRVLAAIPDRDRLGVAVRAAGRDDARVVLDHVAGAAPRLFLSVMAPADRVFRLYVRDGVDGGDRLLVDPAARSTPGHRRALSSIVPSPDGRLVAYGIDDNGDERAPLEILDVDTGRPLHDILSVAGVFTWRPDGRAIFYARRHPDLDGDRPGVGVDTFQHVLGEDPDRDRPVFGPLDARLGLTRVGTAVYGHRDSPWAIAVATFGLSRDTWIYVAPLAEVSEGRAAWRKIAGDGDRIVQVIAHGDAIYAITGDVPTRRIVRFDAARGTMASATTLVPASDDVIVGIAAAADGLYLQRQHGRAMRLARVPWDGGPLTAIPQLAGTSVAWFESRPDAPGAFVALESWTHGPAWFAIDPDPARAAITVRPLAIAPSQAAADDIVVEEVTVTSADGTAVPLTILRPETLTGPAPALLQGYGAYGVSAEPATDPIVLAWIARGGVWADCDTRGGGGWLTPWHQGGIRARKERAVDDYLACAHALVARGLTAPDRLTAISQSSGGVLIGGAITREPALFAAAVLRSPIGNLLRAHVLATGTANIPEYGSVERADDYRAMFASDPYHRVVDGVAYPAVLFSVGGADARVANWQAGKLAARLQHATTSGRPILLRIDRAAGHAGGDRDQLAAEWTDIIAFALWQSGALPAPARGS